MYNMTNITAANNIYELVKATNQSSGDLFANLALLAIFLVVFLSFKSYNFKAVMLADSFVVTFLAIISFILQFTSWHILIYPIIVLMASLVIYMFVE